jgi:hypothetical protein
MASIVLGGDVLEMGCERLDVTSLHRPDTSWSYVDHAGHVHQWHVAGGGPATSYDPSRAYETPTLVWVKDGEEWWEDADEPHAVGHLECPQCGEHVQPRYMADTCTQYIAGLRWYRINGRSVSESDFKARIPPEWL